MPRRGYAVVGIVRPPQVDEGTPRSRRIKYLSLHFNPYNAVTTPPAYELAGLIRWAQPNSPTDNAYGIIDERTTMWIPQRLITSSDFGRTAPEFARSGEGPGRKTQTEEEMWDLWNS